MSIYLRSDEPGTYSKGVLTGTWFVDRYVSFKAVSLLALGLMCGRQQDVESDPKDYDARNDAGKLKLHSSSYKSLGPHEVCRKSTSPLITRGQTVDFSTTSKIGAERALKADPSVPSTSKPNILVPSLSPAQEAFVNIACLPEKS
jgi:hypothetical protein